MMKKNMSKYDLLPDNPFFQQGDRASDNVEVLVAMIAAQKSDLTYNIELAKYSLERVDESWLRDKYGVKKIESVKYKNLNLLELAIFYGNKNTVKLIIQIIPNIRITKTITRVVCKTCNIREPQMSALLNAVRFNDTHLLDRLDHPDHREREVPRLIDSVASNGDTAICLILQRNHDEHFFNDLVEMLEPILNKTCQRNLTPFQLAVELGYQPEYELNAIAYALCKEDR
ncbi:MAG: hypothetical protein M3R00_00185, partial [Pseudomonadota bacterium]|nr:hypothetical protein [Pseudomonadota bacterium]